MQDEGFDFVVIGGGSAGYAAARTGVELGLSVAVVDGAKALGGLCILRGCMPSKTFIESANRYLTLQHADAFGLRAGGIGFDSEAIQARKERLIGEFAAYRREQLEAGTFALIRGQARFLDGHTIEMTEGAEVGRRIVSRTFLIATGSHIHVPDLPGLESGGYWTSDDVLEARETPPSLLVLGAGPIALEFAHYHAALGTQVDVLLRGQELLRGVDPELAGSLREALEKRGVRFHRAARDWQFSRTATGGWRVDYQNENGPGQIEAARILAALGRRPATDGLHLACAGLPDAGGEVRADDRQQTALPHIFAAGDACGRHEIVHVAIQQGEVAARNAARHLGRLGGAPEWVHYRNLVFGVFTWPQLAMAGIRDETAREAGFDPVSARYPFADHGKSIVMGETDGLVKITADRATGKILSGGVVGPEGVELIHEMAGAIQYEATVHTFAKVPHYHPTLGEIWTYPAEELAALCGGS